MATTISMSTFDGMLKHWYIEKKNLYVMDTYENKLLTAIPKKTDAKGKTWNVAVPAGAVVGGASTYANASANATAGRDVDFYGAWKDRFHLGSIEDKVIRLSRAGGGIDEALGRKMESVRDQFNQSANWMLYRSEDGAAAKLDSSTPAIAGNTLVLNFDENTAAPAAQYLRPDSIVRFASTKTGALRTGAWTVTSVSTATVTVTGSSGATTPSAADYVFVDGDAYNNSSAVALAGLESWIPLSDSDVGTFKNVDRSTDKRALGGIRVDASNQTVNEAYIDAAAQGRRYGAANTMIFTHPTRYAQVSKELNGQLRFVPGGKSPGLKLDAKQAAKFGFDAIAVANGGRELTIVEDWACQYNVSWGLELKSLCLHTAGAFPFVRDEDGVKMLRQAGTNYFFELFGYGEMLCYAPGHQIAIKHGTV